MSIRLGNKIISNYNGTGWNIFDFKWADHEITDTCWLRADTFSWQPGITYDLAYTHLVDDIAGKSLTSETINNITIQYYLADDGHKICLASQESNILSLYNAVGIAWYYILDTTNVRFKLPRTKYGFEGYRDTVGKYIPESLPNIKDTVSGYALSGGKIVNTSTNGLFSNTTVSNYTGGVFHSETTRNLAFTFDASQASSTYQNNAPVQEKATQMYLYCYVGGFAQTALEQTAGLNSSLFNNKVDIDATNLSTNGKNLVSSLSMPSTRYTDLTLGASGTNYIAPANGWYLLGKNTGTANTYVSLWNNGPNGDTTIMFNQQYATGTYDTICLFIPCKKGDKVHVSYNGNGSVYMFRFVYAEGGT